MGLRIAVIDSEAMRETVKTWLINIPGPFLRRPDAAAALADVAAGQADVALLPRAYADPVLREGGVSGVLAGALDLRLQAYALAVAPGNAALRGPAAAGVWTRWSVADNSTRCAPGGSAATRDIAERSALRQGLLVQREWTWAIAGGSAVALSALAAVLVRRGRRVATEQARRHEAEAAVGTAEEPARPFLHLAPRPHARRGAEPVAWCGTPTQPSRACSVCRRATLVGAPLAALGVHVDAAVLEQLVQSLASAGHLDRGAAPRCATRTARPRLPGERRTHVDRFGRTQCFASCAT